MKNLILLFLIVTVYSNCSSQNTLPAPSLTVIQEGSLHENIQLKWKASVEKVLGIVIEKKEGDGPWMIIAQVDPTEHVYTDRNKVASTCVYRIRTYGKMTYSDYSQSLAVCENAR